MAIAELLRHGLHLLLTLTALRIRDAVSTVTASAFVPDKRPTTPEEEAFILLLKLSVMMMR